MIYEMDEIESIDIDTKTDFQMAEYFHDKQWILLYESAL
jgi:CMP-N-acetylneuraminic acid synthetase